MYNYIMAERQGNPTDLISIENINRASDLVVAKRPNYSEVTSLLVRGTETERALVLTRTFSGMMVALTMRDISQNTFDRRFNRLVQIDMATTPSGTHEPTATIKTINDLVLGDRTEGFGKKLCTAISTGQMEEHLQRLDIDWCSPARMAEYLRNEAFRFHKVREGHGSSDLEFLLGKCIERDEDPDEDDFLGEVIAALGLDQIAPGERKPRNRRDERHLTSALKELERQGCDAAADFLERVWLNENEPDWPIDFESEDREDD